MSGRGPGRPALPQGVALSEAFKLRLTPEQLAGAERTAAGMGITLQQFVRLAITVLADTQDFAVVGPTAGQVTPGAGSPYHGVDLKAPIVTWASQESPAYEDRRTDGGKLMPLERAEWALALEKWETDALRNKMFLAGRTFLDEADAAALDPNMNRRKLALDYLGLEAADFSNAPAPQIGMNYQKAGSGRNEVDFEQPAEGIGGERGGPINTSRSPSEPQRPPRHLGE